MTTPRVLLGVNGGAPVFRVSKPGKSIYSTDPADFLLNDGAFQHVMIGLYNVSTLNRTSATTSTTTYAWSQAHGLPFIPAVAGLSFYIGLQYVLAGGASGTLTSPYNCGVYSTASTVSLQITVPVVTTAATLTLPNGFPLGLFSTGIR